MKKFILTVAILVFGYTQAQNIKIVDNHLDVDTSPSHMYSTFAAAISAASIGDIIYVQPSETSYGNIAVNKEVTIYGSGHTPELNSGRSAKFSNINISSSNVKISGIETTINTLLTFSGTCSNVIIENSKLFNINLNGAFTNNISIQGNIIDNTLTLDLTTSDSENITIINNFFDTPQSNGIQHLNSSTIFNNNIVVFSSASSQSFFLNPQDLVAQNNIFVSTATFNGVNWQSGGTPILFNNCLTYSYSGIVLGNLNGTGNFNNTNPAFTSIPGTNPVFQVSNDYHVGSGSLGTDGNEVGVYNGFYDFDMRGYPTLLPYITEMTIQNNMIPAGGNLNVNLKANANKTN